MMLVPRLMAVQGVLSFLEQNKDKISERVFVLETKAKIFEATGRVCMLAPRSPLTSLQKDEAIAVQRQLLRLFPDNRDIYAALERLQGLGRLTYAIPHVKPFTCCSAPEAERLAFYKNIQKEYPIAQVPVKAPLEFTTGERFASLVAVDITSGLTKGSTDGFVGDG